MQVRPDIYSADEPRILSTFQAHRIGSWMVFSKFTVYDWCRMPKSMAAKYRPPIPIVIRLLSKMIKFHVPQKYILHVLHVNTMMSKLNFVIDKYWLRTHKNYATLLIFRVVVLEIYAWVIIASFSHARLFLTDKNDDINIPLYIIHFPVRCGSNRNLIA